MWVSMVRERRGDTKRLSIDLDVANPEQKRLWEHWLALSKRGEAARWVRDCLLNAVSTEKMQGRMSVVTQSVAKGHIEATSDVVESHTEATEYVPPKSGMAVPKGNYPPLARYNPKPGGK